MNRLFFVFLLAAILTGCGSTKILAPAPETRNVFIEPSASMTKDCSVSPPPEKELYMNATDQQRMDMLFKYNITTLGDMKKCNAQWATLRVWYEDNRKRYAEDKK